MQQLRDIKQSCYMLSNVIFKEKVSLSSQSLQEDILRAIKIQFQAIIDTLTNHLHGLLHDIQFSFNDFHDKFKTFQNKLLSQTLDSSVFLKNVTYLSITIVDQSTGIIQHSRLN